MHSFCFQGFFSPPRAWMCWSWFFGSFFLWDSSAFEDSTLLFSKKIGRSKPKSALKSKFGRKTKKHAHVETCWCHVFAEQNHTKKRSHTDHFCGWIVAGFWLRRWRERLWGATTGFQQGDFEVILPRMVFPSDPCMVYCGIFTYIYYKTQPN